MDDICQAPSCFLRGYPGFMTAERGGIAAVPLFPVPGFPRVPGDGDCSASTTTFSMRRKHADDSRDTAKVPLPRKIISGKSR